MHVLERPASCLLVAVILCDTILCVGNLLPTPLRVIKSGTEKNTENGESGFFALFKMHFNFNLKHLLVY